MTSQRYTDRTVDGAAAEPAFSHIVRLVRTALDVPFAKVTLTARDAGWLTSIQGATVIHPDALHPLCRIAVAERSDGVLTVTDTAADPRFADAGPMENAPDVRSFAGVPLTLSSGTTVGVLYAADVSPRTFLAGECSMLLQLGDCVLRELELRERAACDDLTGFLTRKPFFDALQRTLGEYVAHATPASLAILDLDHFKAINDRFGHVAGDRVLTCVADVSRAILGRSASFGRLGGEEFALAFPGMGVDAATDRLCELRAAIEAIRLPGVPEMIVTGSIGVAGVSDDIPTVSAWCKMADAALYGAKQAGRNCVIVSRNTRAVPPERPRGPVVLGHRPHSAAQVAHNDPAATPPAHERGGSVTPLHTRRGETG